MTNKVFVCRCEDVTRSDVEEAIERGFSDIESVKRYTGLGTGWCQGKQCLANCARLIADKTGARVSPFTPRPPFHPVALSDLAKILDREPGDE